MSVFKSVLASEKNQASSADNAKNRLHFLIYNEPGTVQDEPDFLPELHKELLEVLRRHIPDVDDSDVEVKYENLDGAQIIEMSLAFEKKDLHRR